MQIYQSQPYNGTVNAQGPSQGQAFSSPIIGTYGMTQGSNLQPGGQIQNAFNSLSSNIQQPGGMQAAGSPLNSGPMDQVRSWQSGQMGAPAMSPMMQAQASGGSWNPWGQAAQQNQAMQSQPNQMALQNQFGQMGQQMGQRSLFGSQNQSQPMGWGSNSPLQANQMRTQMSNMMGGMPGKR